MALPHACTPKPRYEPIAASTPCGLLGNYPLHRCHRPSDSLSTDHANTQFICRPAKISTGTVCLSAHHEHTLLICSGTHGRIIVGSLKRAPSEEGNV